MRMTVETLLRKEEEFFLRSGDVGPQMGIGGKTLHRFLCIRLHNLISERRERIRKREKGLRGGLARYTKLPSPSGRLLVYLKGTSDAKSGASFFYQRERGGVGSAKRKNSVKEKGRRRKTRLLTRLSKFW